MEAVSIADIFPDEGLDYLLGIVPKNGSNLANTFLGLYTASQGTSCPPTTTTLVSLGGPGATSGGAAGTAGYAEISTTQWSTYTRQTHAAGSWGAQGASTIWSTVGRKVDGSQMTFAAPSAPYSPSPNGIAGFFLATAITGGVAIYYSNFGDGSTIASLAIGDIVKVTPTFGLGN